MAIHRNEVVVLASLPAVADMEFERLDVAYLRQQRVLWSLLIGVPAVAGVVVAVVLGAPGWVPLAVAAAALALGGAAWVLEGLAFAYRGVQVREHDVSVRRGLISRRTITVPFTRVQHVAVPRGPVDRIFGLATVVVYTAGARGADARVHGLAPERAERLRQALVKRSAEVSGHVGR